jgi:predicted amidohydrolase YtcJ
MRSTLVVLCLAWALPAAAQEADLILTGGRVVTLDEARPEVRALAAKDGRVLALGSVDEIAAHWGPATRVIQLEGRLAIPGFIEGHGHFLGVGDGKMQLDLMSAASWEQILVAVEHAVSEAAPGELIRGRGWHQEKWTHLPEGALEGLPVHEALSALSPDNPVLLTHASGHALFANSNAMELCGIDRRTPDPEGGQIVRDGSGAPTGVFRETAAGLLTRARFAARAPDPRKLAEYANDECLAKGVTSFQDAGSSFETVDLFKAMADEGRLGVRLWVMLREPNERLAAGLASYRMIDYGNRHLTVRAIKRSLDGALGSHGAWMLEPYEDLPDSVGLNTLPLDDLARTAELALEGGYQLCVHAIGDRANREVLDLYERTWAGRPGGGRDLRWRIEHAQHLHPKDVPRFGRLGVIASMQGVHCTSDAPWVLARLGEARARSGAYLWRSLLDTGALVTNGTDAPVEDVDPIRSFAATVTRRLADGSVFFPEQRLSRLEALRSYTLSAAEAAFEEQHKGSLSPGKLADVVVLTRDILDCPEDLIVDTRVRYTIVGGRVLYDSEAPTEER